EDGIRDRNVTGVQTCALPISSLISCNMLVNISSFAGPFHFLASVICGEYVLESFKKPISAANSSTFFCKKDNDLVRLTQAHTTRGRSLLPNVLLDSTIV